MSNIFSFKIAIFDLDNTLWNGETLFEDTKLILSTLKSSGVKMYIASFHNNAAACCKQLGIDSYFEDILYGRNKSKLDMVKYVIKVNPSAMQTEMVFFDDDTYNINDISVNTEVHVIHINNTGIRWDSITSEKKVNVPILDTKCVPILDAKCVPYANHGMDVLSMDEYNYELTSEVSILADNSEW